MNGVGGRKQGAGTGQHLLRIRSPGSAGKLEVVEPAEETTEPPAAEATETSVHGVPEVPPMPRPVFIARVVIGALLATGVLEVYLTAVSNRLNDDTKQLALVATIFLPLTFLTGIFGQNFGWLVENVDSKRDFLLFGMAARRWVRPVPLEGVSYVASLLRLQAGAQPLACLDDDLRADPGRPQPIQDRTDQIMGDRFHQMVIEASFSRASPSPACRACTGPAPACGS